MKRLLGFCAVLAMGIALFALPSLSAPVGPTVRIGAPTPAETNSGRVVWPVTYEDAKRITLRKRDVSIDQTGTATYGVMRIQEPTPTTRNIVLAQVSGDGTLRANIAPGTARDRVGNTAAGAGPSDPVTVDNTPPTLTISAPEPADTRNGPVSFIVTYSGADMITLQPSDISILSDEGLTGDVTIEVVSPTQRRVIITNIRKATGGA